MEYKTPLYINNCDNGLIKNCDFKGNISLFLIIRSEIKIDNVKVIDSNYLFDLKDSNLKINNINFDINENYIKRNKNSYINVMI